MQVKPKTGGIQTKDAFGSVQLHIEFATPTVVKGEGQGRGNSGIFLMNTYEIQVLDSYQNPTYFHGQAGSIYKQHTPLVNPIRKPGEWNVYEIVFHAPKFDEDGKLLQRATFTAFLNGVLVQDHVEVMGVTAHDRPPYYEKHADKMPIGLQDHGDLVRFRNIWVTAVGIEHANSRSTASATPRRAARLRTAFSTLTSSVICGFACHRALCAVA